MLIRRDFGRIRGREFSRSVNLLRLEGPGKGPLNPAVKFVPALTGGLTVITPAKMPCSDDKLGIYTNFSVRFTYKGLNGR